MEPVSFVNEETKAIWDQFRFDICDPKNTTIEGCETETTDEQIGTEQACKNALQLYYLHMKTKEPKLDREKHVQFLLKVLTRLPHECFSLESSRTWIAFWCLHGLRMLKHNVDHHILSRLVEFLRSCQKDTGGFGGSPQHYAHLATTYAAIMALVSIGTEEALSVINRKTLYDFLMSVKQPNGSFKMQRDGEIDCRGVYCAAAVATITQIMDEKLFEGTAAWLISCQTYEGGFGAEPFVEAHGGYTYCAVAALAILQKVNMMNIDRLLYWSAERQMSYEGGFQGRANKLVDACYSFWMGAIFPIMDYELEMIDDKKYKIGSLFDADGLQAYIIYLCQELTKGGIRDKPEKNPDAYHTCYALAGLAVSQHYARREKGEILGGEENALEDVNPLYNVVSSYYEFTTKYFGMQPKI